jgi:dihydroorotase
VLDLMKPDDILAHPFSRHPGGFVSKNGGLASLVREAVARGLKIDVGHGSHFSFNVARTVLEAGSCRIRSAPTCMGTTPGQRTPADPGAARHAHLFAGKTRFSLVSAMTSMMALGLPGTGRAHGDQQRGANARHAG